MNNDLRATKLHKDVVNARLRLRAVEEKHERLLGEGSPEHRLVGREYAAIVQKYTNSVMAWLSSLERWTDQPQGAQIVSTPETTKTAAGD